MEDTDLIARVYPHGDGREYGKSAIKANWRHMPARLPQQEEDERSRSSRESTQPEEDDDDPDRLPYLELRFSDVPRSSSGLVFGTDPNISDIALPGRRGISKRHFALTYKNKFSDGCYRLVVRDLGSTSGTLVEYDDKGGKELRSKFDWIINGFDITDDTENFVVGLGDKGPKFRIVVARHDIASPVYVDNVERFRQGAANAEELLGGFGLESGRETKRDSDAQTPDASKRPILLPLGWIAQGQFGVVSRHWNVSTGEEYACKEPVGSNYNRELWKREIDIMEEISKVGKDPFLFFFFNRNCVLTF